MKMMENWYSPARCLALSLIFCRVRKQFGFLCWEKSSTAAVDCGADAPTLKFIRRRCANWVANGTELCANRLAATGSEWYLSFVLPINP